MFFLNYKINFIEYLLTIGPDSHNVVDYPHSMLPNIEQLAIDPVEAVKEDADLLDTDNPLKASVVPTFDLIKDELDKIDTAHISELDNIHEELDGLKPKMFDGIFTLCKTVII